MEVFGNLSKRLRDIEDLPLKVVSVQPISPGNILAHSFMFFLNLQHSIRPLILGHVNILSEHMLHDCARSGSAQ